MKKREEVFLLYVLFCLDKLVKARIERWKLVHADCTNDRDNPPFGETHIMGGES